MKRSFSIILIICVVLMMGDLLLAKRYQITFMSGQISQKKPNGKGWDVFGNPPDPFVKVLINGQIQCQTSVQKDTFTPYWNEEFTINHNKGDSFSIQVFDKDLSFHDEIGILNTTEIREGEGELEFGSVRALKIRIKLK